MERKLVSSSILHSVGYDAKRSTLQVQFHGGRVYNYLDVPAVQYSRLMSAESKGTYFDVHIRDKYPTKRVL